MTQVVTIIAGDHSGGPYSRATMLMDEGDITDGNLRQMRQGVSELYAESFGKAPVSMVVTVDDHLHDYVIPAYVARVAGTDHAESAHDTLSAAAHKALETEMTVLVAVTPERTS